jgi:uridine kinase
MMDSAQSIAEQILRIRLASSRTRPLRVAISGIDASGKSTLARAVEEILSVRGFRVALITVDAWHQPAAVRFSDTDPARHFYRHAFRFEEMFRRLVTPLHATGSVSLTANLTSPAGDAASTRTYWFRDIEIILLEGIFLLRRDLREQYDLSFWIDCSFATALDRAVSRNQEGQPLERLVADYQRIYFPAQRFHLATDWPRFFADVLLASEQEPTPALTFSPRTAAHPPATRRGRHGFEQTL